MKKFTPVEYLMIDIANAFGKDKLLFEERIEFVKENGKNLFKIANEADDYAMYMKAVMALRHAMTHGTTSHPVGLDATASGNQVMAAVTGCLNGAAVTGMIDPNKRCDAYTELMFIMNKYLPEDKWIKMHGEGLTRQHLKDAFMTFFYNSTQNPINIFGKGTVQLQAFYKACEEMCTGAYYLMSDLDGAKNPEKLIYSWVLPDGHNAVTKVMSQVSKKIVIDEIPNASGNGSTFNHVYDEMRWNPFYKAIPANVVHSLDGYVVREMNRRCNHNKDDLMNVYSILQGCKVTDTSDIVSLSMVNDILKGETNQYTDNQLGRLLQVIEGCVDNPSFPMMTIHDEFKTYPQFCNEMRQYYIDIFAEMAESNVITGILNSLYENPNGTYEKQQGHQELPNLIRQSNYMLC